MSRKTDWSARPPRGCAGPKIETKFLRVVALVSRRAARRYYEITLPMTPCAAPDHGGLQRSILSDRAS